MTLDEAIKHCLDKAAELDREADKMYPPTIELDDRYNDCRDCAFEHRQLAEWLSDYKKLLECYDNECVGCGGCDRYKKIHRRENV